MLRALPLLVIAGLAPHFIPPGQEALLSEMFGKGVALPGECAWAGASVEETRVVSWFTCAGERTELELRHISDATGSVARTSRFAIRTPGSAPPPGLVEAIAQRVREREGTFVWTGRGDSVLALPHEDQRPLVQWLGFSLVSLSVVAATLFWLSRRWRGAQKGSARWVWLVSLGFAAASFGTVRSFGNGLMAGLAREPGVPLATATGLMLLCAALALSAAALLNVLPSALPRWVRLLGGPALFVAVGYPLSLSTAPPQSFTSMAVNDVQVEQRRDRPAVTYRTGPLGFRTPGWLDPKPAGMRRIGLFGDSYVFGIGVEEADTLSAALKTELEKHGPVEVINLGVPGANLSTSVDLVEATSSLELDTMIFCLTLPNDLSQWDGQQARREAGRFGAYSFTRFMLGQSADVLWDLSRLERATTERGLAHLDRELARLAALRERAVQAPQLWFYSFRDLPSAVATRLGAIPGAHVIPEGESFPEDFLPTDGHPTPQGNRHSARRIAGFLGAP